ncbi:Uncharacterized protein OBRU01_07172 [Operophtera brumata]|uniref:Uncharacterized protein n=1 Tax=Operophtera brumata TaxID=104452 RepID=A0A0L7L5K5_OPEBR|nr:Uncharacterized protein OBRU01_07172 [Operophtera brumata]
MKAWTAHEHDTTISCCRTLHVKHAAYASALYTLIAYFAIIGTQMFMIILSIFLFYGVYKENVAFLVPWVVGCMTFMALEAMAMVYSNVLRDHVNKQFDSVCKAEILFLIPRMLVNCLCLYCVLRLYHLLRAGVTWKGAAPIEL